MIALLLAFLLLLPIHAHAEDIDYNPEHKPLQQKILGITREQWMKDLSNLEDKVDGRFLDILLKEEKALKSKRSSDHFEKLGSDPDKVERIRNNPLHSGASSRKRFITDLSLRKSDYVKIFSLIPMLKKQYYDDEVAAYLPYCALAVNEGIKFPDILFYAQREVHMQTPIDIATERLYMEVEWHAKRRTP